MLSLSEPILEEAEKDAVLDTMNSGWITMGDRVQQFENDFAQLHNHTDAVAVNSCTSGLHIALVALGVGPGDEVLVPSLTFVATINVIKYVGAEPVFVDVVSTHEPHICLIKAKAKITNKTKAVMIMHYGGYPCDVRLWRAFSDQNNLALIEDAAHAPACKGVGIEGDITVFSFFSNKNMTTSEGGMLLTNAPKLSEKLRNLRSHGMTSVTLDRHKGHAYSYDVTDLGYNYRLDEIRAAIGIEQIKKLGSWNESRAKNAALYKSLLRDNKVHIELPFDNIDETVGHLMPILLPVTIEREQVMDKLRDQGIQSSIHYPPAHKFTYYRSLYPNVSLPVTEEYCSRELSLPLHPRLSFDEINYICEKLIEACEG